MQDALTAVLSLPFHEKQKRGLIHTPQEIHQQPETWLKTLRKVMNAHRPLLEFLEEVGIAPDSAALPHVILTGAGTSDFTGKALAPVLRQRWKCDVSTIPSTDLLTEMEHIISDERKYLMVSFSRSGDSSEGVAVVEQALELYSNVRHLVITCNEQGSLTKFPNVMSLSLDDVVNDRGLAMTSSFSNMVVAGQFLANIRNSGAYERLLHGMAGIASRSMQHAADLASDLAKRGFSKMCFIGTGALHAVAEESALKVLELNAGKISTLAESALGLRHGPLSFVDKETLLVCYLSGEDYRSNYELDLLEEVLHKELAAEVVVLAPRITNRTGGLKATLLSLDAPEGFPDAYRPPIDVIFGQLLGLFTAMENDITPDSPSNGAIGRVVSHVKIYPVCSKAGALP